MICFLVSGSATGVFILSRLLNESHP